MEKKGNQYWQLFQSTFLLSAFTFGGGYVIIPLMKKKFVDTLHWFSEEDMLNFAAIAQSSPGAVAVNASIIVGYKMKGFMGIVISVLGTVLPPLLILSTISIFYAMFQSNLFIQAVLKAMQIGVGIVIIDVVIGMAQSIIRNKNLVSISVMIGSFVLLQFLKVNLLIVILISGFIGVIEQQYGRKGI